MFPYAGRLRERLTLSYRVGRAPRSFRPRIAHRAPDGSWNLVPARLTRSGRLVVRTKTFSGNFPSWLNPQQWRSNLEQWARNAGQWVASGVAGRTPSLGNCEPPKPAWFSFEKRSDMVHVCAIDNKGRAEIQLKSNRGITVEVNVPGNPTYVWVENQPWELRKRLPWDANRIVLLGPGQRMTVGYDRPPTAQGAEFKLSGSTPRAFADDAARALFDLVADRTLSVEALMLYTWAQCGANLQRSLTGATSDPPRSIGAFVGCQITSVPTLLDRDEEAVRLVQRMGGDKKGLQKLLEDVKQFKRAVKLFELYPFIQATAIQALDDGLRTHLGGGSDDRVPIRLQGTAAVDETVNADSLPLIPSPVPNPASGPGVTPGPPAARVNAYDNYGLGAVGRAMCRGNPNAPLSMPGGSASQTFVVPLGVASLDSALVQIDADSRVTAHAGLCVDGALRATADTAAAGDTRFAFGRVATAAGQSVTLTISFSATFGKIITVYTVGNPKGIFSATNQCPDSAPSVPPTGTTGLRAVITGWTR